MSLSTVTNMAVKPIELLAPAGDKERLTMAVTYGADAVYLAGQSFGMRAAAGNFDEAGLCEAVLFCHQRGVKVYVTCNTLLRNEEMQALPQFLRQLEAAGADAVIVSDLGALTLAKKYAPRTALHISTQAGILSADTAKAYHDLGASRVILARELSLGEIRTIRDNVPDSLELEAFVHGSMCMAFSGRCLLSNYLAGRDANAGACAQPCRWKYRLIEERRADEAIELTEDGGTYIFNSRDLNMIDHLPAIIDAGVTSLKIEGRMKSAYYAAVVTNAYRHALDAALQGQELSPVWSREVYKVSHREYATGFYFGKEGPGQYYKDAMYFSDCDVVAVVESWGEDNVALLTQRNRFFEGDALELLTPEGEPVRFTAAGMTNLEGEALQVVPHPMMAFRMPLPKRAEKYALVRRVKQKVPEIAQ